MTHGAVEIVVNRTVVEEEPQRVVATVELSVEEISGSGQVTRQTVDVCERGVDLLHGVVDVHTRQLSSQGFNMTALCG